MANIIRPKRSSTVAKVPTTTDLSSGEFGVNMADQKCYINNGTSVVQVASGKLAGLGDVTLTSLTSGQGLAWNGTAWVNSSAGAGSVTSVSIVSANGLAGTVATATSTPAITLSTTITGLLKGNATAISAAVSGTDYAPATSGGSILYGNGAGGFSAVTVGTGLSFTTGTLSATNAGTVTSVTGTAPIASSGGATPAISIAQATTTVSGYLTSTDWNTFNNKQVAGSYLTATTGVTTFSGSTTGLTPSTATSGAITLGGTLAIANGGTNSTATATLGGVGYGTGTAHAYTSVGTAGQAIVSNGASAPSFQTLTLLNLPDAWVKKACDCATTVALTINTAQTVIDGVTISATSRVLVKNQATASQNGIYTGVTTTTWVRSTDADTASKIAGAFVNVDTGTVNGGKVFDNDFKSTDTLGTTAMTFAQNVDVGYFTTVGNSFSTLTNPSAITFPQINADNTVTAQTAANFRTAIGAGTSSTTGTVTSVAALTLGTTGTDLSSTVATGTTTPVITLQVPTASATNRGALSSADWTTFNGKGTGTVTSVGGTGTVVGLTLTGTVATTGSLTLGGTFALPTGQVTTRMIYDAFTATALQTTFTTSTTYTSGKIDVFCNGVRMNGGDVTVTSGTTVVFATGLAVGSLVNLVYPT